MKYVNKRMKMIHAMACAAMVCVLAGCGNGSGSQSQSANDASRIAGALPPEEVPPKASATRDRGTAPPRLSPEAESNPCRTTALVLEQLLERSAQDFAQQN